MGMIGNTLAQGLISGANIQDGTVDTPDLKDSAVTASKIAAGVVSPAKMDFTGGTANGVPYLNGSKALTSGSALTFDGTNFGLGTATPQNYGAGVTSATIDASSTSSIDLRISGTRYGRIYASTSALNIDTWSGTGPIVFGINTNEAMRLTSTGLTVNGTNGYNVQLSGGNAYRMYATTNDLVFRSVTAGSDVMTMTYGGNVGIGTSSPAGRLTLRGAAGTSGKNQGILLEYSNGTEYGAFGLNNGSGWPQIMARAGAGLTFHVNSDLLTTGEAMRLDSSGNLGLGTTTNTYRLNVDAGTVSPIAARFNASNATYGVATIWARNNTDMGQAGSLGSIVGGGSLVDFALNASNQLVFCTGYTERARIDTAGRLLVNRTTGSMMSSWGSISLGNGATLAGPAAAGDFNALLTANAYYDGAWKRVGSSASSILEMLFGGNRVQFFTAGSSTPNSTITWSDGPYIANGGNTWTNGSDEKLKNITGEIEDAVAKVMQIRAARYTWKKDPDNKPQVGLIAQDLQKVLPEVVVEPPELTDQYGNETYLGVNYDQVIPLLVAAIKEQQAIIEDMKTRLAAAGV